MLDFGVKLHQTCGVWTDYKPTDIYFISSYPEEHPAFLGDILIIKPAATPSAGLPSGQQGQHSAPISSQGLFAKTLCSVLARALANTLHMGN